MARKSNNSELREVWQEAAVSGDDGMRRMVERVVQQVLEAEMTAFVGADSNERTGERRGYGNGYKPRTLKTRVGELELMVPRIAMGSSRWSYSSVTSGARKRWCWPSRRCMSKGYPRARCAISPRPSAGWRSAKAKYRHCRRSSTRKWSNGASGRSRRPIPI